MRQRKAKSKVRDELTVGEVAARIGIAVSAIQFYEGKGLIAGVRTAGRRRRYTSDVLQRVALIRTAHGVGIPLSTVRNILSSLPAQRRPSREDWRVVLESWRSEVNARIAGLQELRADLVHCETCGCLDGETCPLLAPDTHAEPD